MKKFKEKLKIKLEEKIPKDIYQDNNFNNFFNFNQNKENEGIKKILLESFQEIKKELLNQTELTQASQENETKKSK